MKSPEISFFIKTLANAVPSAQFVLVFRPVIEIAESAKENSIVKKFAGDSFLIVAGSTWVQDEEILLKYLYETVFNVKIVIAPHEIHEHNLRRIESMFSENIIRYSKANNSYKSENKVLLIDNIGLLSSIYKSLNFAKMCSVMLILWFITYSIYQFINIVPR